MDFSWIADFGKWCARLLPFHLGLCKATEGGVKFKRGKHVVEIKPGVYWYWPLLTEIELIPVKRQPLDIAPQSLTTADDKTVYVRAVVIYEVADVTKALVDTHEYDGTAAEVAAAAVVKVVLSRVKDVLRRDMIDVIPNELGKAVRAELKKYGLYVIEARLSEMAESRVIRTVGDGDVIPDEDE